MHLFEGAGVRFFGCCHTLPPGEVGCKRNTIESLRGTHVYVDWNTVFRIPQFGYRCVFAMYFADPPVTTRDPKLLSDLLKAIQRHTVCDTTDWGWKSQYTNHTSRDTCSSRDGFLRNKKDRSNHGVPSQTKNTGHGAGTEGCWGWDWGVLHCIHSDVGDFRIDGQIYGIYGQDWLKPRAQAFDTNKGNDTYRVVHTASHLVLRPAVTRRLCACFPQTFRCSQDHTDGGVCTPTASHLVLRPAGRAAVTRRWRTNFQ